jgi:hypothetical protein
VTDPAGNRVELSSRRRAGDSSAHVHPRCSLLGAPGSLRTGLHAREPRPRVRAARRPPRCAGRLRRRRRISLARARRRTALASQRSRSTVTRHEQHSPLRPRASDHPAQAGPLTGRRVGVGTARSWPGLRTAPGVRQGWDRAGSRGPGKAGTRRCPAGPEPEGGRGGPDEPPGCGAAGRRRRTGFMPPAEGWLLYGRRRRTHPVGPVLEDGTYCGKSTVYLAARPVRPARW